MIVAGILAVPLTWWAGRRLDLEEGQARAAAAMLAFSPAAMIYGVASADALFATLGLVCVPLFLGREWGSRTIGAVALAIASFFSWALLAIGAFAALFVMLRDGIKQGLMLGLLAGFVLGFTYLSLYAASGYDPLGVLHSANEAYELGISNARPWIFWLFGSPVAFFVFTGAPGRLVHGAGPGHRQRDRRLAVRGDRDRGAARLQQGGDGADLALPRAARLSGRRHDRPA